LKVRGLRQGIDPEDEVKTKKRNKIKTDRGDGGEDHEVTKALSEKKRGEGRKGPAHEERVSFAWGWWKEKKHWDREGGYLKKRHTKRNGREIGLKTRGESGKELLEKAWAEE